MPKIYPDTSSDVRNIPIAPRLVLASDVIKINPGLIDSGRTIRETDGSDTPIGDTVTEVELGGGGGCCKSPSDEEYIVQLDTLGNINEIEADVDFFFLSHFVNWKIRAYRNNIPMINLNEDENGYTWNMLTGKFTPFIKPVEGEVFTFQVDEEMPDPVTLTAIATGSNINNVIVDNGIVFLPTFVNTRMRVTRNNILQSFKTDFAWDNEFAQLTLTVNPVLDEEFIFEPY